MHTQTISFLALTCLSSTRSLSNNNLGPRGMKGCCKALLLCPTLRSLDLSQNSPGRGPAAELDGEQALEELLCKHPGLTRVGIVESLSKQGLDQRALTNIGEALRRRKQSSIQFLSCDAFRIRAEDKVLNLNDATGWPKPHGERLLAGVLMCNATLTEVSLDTWSQLSKTGRKDVGDALLRNKISALGYCNLLGLRKGDQSVTLNFKDGELRNPETVQLFAGLMSNNRELSHLRLLGVSDQEVIPLVRALRENSHLKKLELMTAFHESSTTGQRRSSDDQRRNIVLPVQDLNGRNGSTNIDLNLWNGGSKDRMVAGERLERVHLTLVAQLLGENSSVLAVRLNAGPHELGLRHFLTSLAKIRKGGCTLRALDVSSTNLGPRGGSMLFDTLQSGKCKELVCLHLAYNHVFEGAMADSAAEAMQNLLLTETCRVEELDLRGNSIMGATLEAVFTGNRSLTFLDVRDNSAIDDEVLAKLVRPWGSELIPLEARFNL